MAETIFSRNLKKVRNLKGWSQEGAASAIGIKRSLLQAYEKGRIEPSNDTLVQIANAYEIKDLQAFMIDSNYILPDVSAEDIYSRYMQLPWYERKAINAILGIDCYNM